MLKEQINSNIILQGINSLIEKCYKDGQNNNTLLKVFESCGGIETIEKCTRSKNEKISERAIRSLEIFEKKDLDENSDCLMESVTTNIAF
jgi:hypothetical protein